MEITIRKTRTLKVTELKISDQELQLLAELPGDPRYDALLDVMERACISIDTSHLETPSSDPEAILGGHCVSKGAWNFFIYVQKQIQAAYHRRTGMEEAQPEPRLEDMMQSIEGFTAVEE